MPMKDGMKYVAWMTCVFPIIMVSHSPQKYFGGSEVRNEEFGIASVFEHEPTKEHCGKKTYFTDNST